MEEKQAVLIAARKDVTEEIVELENDVFTDRLYTKGGRSKEAGLLIIVCVIRFRQTIGHLGLDIVVCGVHGNHLTMKLQWREAYDDFWNQLSG